MRARTIVAVCTAAAASGGLWLGVRAGSSEGGAADPAGARTGTNTATVERRDLVERESLDGTLGFAGSRTVANQLSATLTRLPSVGSLIGLGESLYEVNGKPSAWLLYGSRPAWRGFQSGMSDGEDVAQLEASLQALGYDPGVVNDEFTDYTEAAIERFQYDRGMKADGRFEPGEVVFLPGRVRVKARRASSGMMLRPGQELLDTTSTKRVVTVQLDATRQTLVARGDSVEVELPSGEVVEGRITKVSRVASPPAQEGEVATVDVTIVLRGRAGARSFDGAPVTVGFAQEQRRNALSVPVAALLALEGGGTAVEVVGADGATRTVRVRTGLFADGYVGVASRRLRAGMKVVVPDEL